MSQENFGNPSSLELSKEYFAFFLEVYGIKQMGRGPVPIVVRASSPSATICLYRARNLVQRRAYQGTRWMWIDMWMEKASADGLESVKEEAPLRYLIPDEWPVKKIDRKELADQAGHIKEVFEGMAPEWLERPDLTYQALKAGQSADSYRQPPTGSS